MKSDIQVFGFQGKRVRVIARQGEPWWVVRDVCEVLELGNPSMAVSRLEADEVSSTEVIDSMGRTQETNIVNEPGLYGLIMGSRKPEAKEFKRWVTHEVLPSIRKTGAYSVYGPQTMVGEFSVPSTYSGAMRLAADLTDKLEASKQTIAILEPKAAFHDQVAETVNCIPVAKFAKLMGTGEKRMFAWLRSQGLLMTGNVPYQRYIDEGYFKVREGTYPHPGDGQQERCSYVQTTITGKGQTYLQKRWTKDGNAVQLRLAER